MTADEMLAEADRLDREAQASIDAASMKAIVDGRLDPRSRLLYTPESVAMLQRARDLRSDAALDDVGESDAPRSNVATQKSQPAPTTVVTSARIPSVSKVSRETGIRTIAAGYAAQDFYEPQEAVAGAIADGQSIEAFALAWADKAIRHREIEAAAAQIGTDAGLSWAIPSLRSEPCAIAVRKRPGLSAEALGDEISALAGLI